MADLRLLQAGASELGVELTRDQLSAFSLYMVEMLKWNQRANLTAITAPDEIQTKHFLDSLTCLLGFPRISRPAARSQDPAAAPVDLAEQLHRGAGLACLDVGTGAGFPGVPLKICLPEMSLTLLDSIGKKTAFLSHLVQTLGLSATRVVTARAEDLARKPAERERYDVVVARAVSRMAVVAELCLPLCRIGGRTIALKKGDLAQEMDEGRYAVRTMGGEYAEPIPVQLSLLEAGRLLVIMDKVSPTPDRYPRRAGVPAKNPLLASSTDSLPVDSTIDPSLGPGQGER